MGVGGHVCSSPKKWSRYLRLTVAQTGEHVSTSTRLLCMTTLRADAQRNRRLLLEAAGELFAARGLAVTLDDVARHAGVGVGTAYRRLANKEELIDEPFN